jgi:hypothetical protein
MTELAWTFPVRRMTGLWIHLQDCIRKGGHQVVLFGTWEDRILIAPENQHRHLDAAD